MGSLGGCVAVVPRHMTGPTPATDLLTGKVPERNGQRMCDGTNGGGALLLIGDAGRKNHRTVGEDQRKVNPSVTKKRTLVRDGSVPSG